MSRRATITQAQRLIIVNGMLGFVTLIVILQLWLFTATMESYLGGDYSMIWPAALVSLGCLALNVGLLFYLGRLDRSYEIAGSSRFTQSNVGEGSLGPEVDSPRPRPERGYRLD